MNRVKSELRAAFATMHNSVAIGNQLISAVSAQRSRTKFQHHYRTIFDLVNEDVFLLID